MSLFVVYTPDTGHVVGAIDSTGAPPLPPADPTGAVAADPLVGKALPLRVSVGAGEIATLSLPVRELAAHAPDDEPGVLAEPLSFGVEQVAGQPPKPALVPLLEWTGGLEFSQDGLKVTLPVAPTQDTQVVALVSDGDGTKTASGQLAAGTTLVELAVAVDSGVHGVLVLVAGWVGRLEAVTKS
jgi:hypothetical protein